MMGQMMEMHVTVIFYDCARSQEHQELTGNMRAAVHAMGQKRCCTISVAQQYPLPN